MGLDVLRGNNTRCPPFLVGGLIIMCLFLLCNWWSLSSQNIELLKQIDNLGQQLSVNSNEIAKCSQQKIILNEKLKNSQNKFVEQQIIIDQLKESEGEAKENFQKTETELEESKKKVLAIEKNLRLCHTELESLKKLSESKDKTLDTFRAEKESLKFDLVQKDNKIKELEGNIKSSNTENELTKNKLMQSLVKNMNEIKKKQKNDDLKKAVGEMPQQQDLDGKNYGDSGLLSVDNDPREEEMRGP